MDSIPALGAYKQTKDDEFYYQRWIGRLRSKKTVLISAVSHMCARNVPAPSAASVTRASPRGHSWPRMPATLEELLQQRASFR